jgi:hypothetical protein
MCRSFGSLTRWWTKSAFWATCRCLHSLHRHCGCSVGRHFLSPKEVNSATKLPGFSGNEVILINTGHFGSKTNVQNCIRLCTRPEIICLIAVSVKYLVGGKEGLRS